MSRSRSSRSQRYGDEAKVTYEIEMPFESRNSKIHLREVEEDEIEVIIAQIPVPEKYDTHRNHPKRLEDDEDKMRANVTAKWVLKDSARILDKYEWRTSSSKTNNPYYHLEDVYFTCSIDELDEAVMRSKKFLTKLEENVLNHAKEFDMWSNKKPSDHFK
jgi:hypothetical protein